jgi:acetolactate synthase-1/2/3 large subunit
MNIDHQALFRPITKLTISLNDQAVRKPLLDAACVACSSMSGPVHIGVPSDISQRKAPEEQNQKEYNKKEYYQKDYNQKDYNWADSILKIKGADKNVIEDMKKTFAKAQKPLIVLGLSAVQARLKDHRVNALIIELIEKFKIPVVLTPMAKGMVSQDHPLYAGVLIHALANIVGQTHTQADLIIGIGYDPVEVNYEDWVPNVPIIHINITPADLDTDSFTLAADVVGDIKSSIKSLLTATPLNNNWDLNALLNRKQKMFESLKSVKGSFGSLVVLEKLRAILPDDGILTCDVGAHLHLIGQKWFTPEPECLLMTNGWSSMGFSIPAAIAAKLCRPEKNVVCITGDGGFLMMAGEMATAQRLGLHIVFIVLSDKELSLIRIKQKHKNHPTGYGTTLCEQDCPDSDFFLGVPVFNPKDLSSYEVSLQKAFAMKGPVLIKVSIDNKEYDNLVLRGNK